MTDANSSGANQAQDAPKTKHVVFIGLDGVQYKPPIGTNGQILEVAGVPVKSDLVDLNTEGKVDGIMKLDVVDSYAGKHILANGRAQQTISGQGWTSILTGLWQDEHGFRVLGHIK